MLLNNILVRILRAIFRFDAAAKLSVASFQQQLAHRGYVG
jgi:hypothetical protein